ncbi:DNA-directed RNA polymerase subunit alpha [Elusimicrobiota bacterium]
MKMPDLEKLRKLTIDEKTATSSYARFVAEPFERGYGHTIGNALCRILLSSIEGAAISAVRIKGAMHEFAVLKGVKEDSASIILNIKQIRLKMFSGGSETLFLKAKGEGKITAKDIEKNANIEILNPDQEIANLDYGGSLEIEMEVSKGKGYVMADENKTGKSSANTMLLDTLFSPVVKVNYEVEDSRVEQITDYDRLVIEIWTDGSVAPVDALAYAANISKNSVSIFSGPETKEEVIEKDPEQEKLTALLGQPLAIMDLSVRSANCLLAAGLKTVGDLVTKNEDEVCKYKNFGQRSKNEINDKLKELGLSLGMTIEEDNNND